METQGTTLNDPLPLPVAFPYNRTADTDRSAHFPTPISLATFDGEAEDFAPTLLDERSQPLSLKSRV